MVIEMEVGEWDCETSTHHDWRPPPLARSARVLVLGRPLRPLDGLLAVLVLRVLGPLVGAHEQREAVLEAAVV